MSCFFITTPKEDVLLDIVQIFRVYRFQGADVASQDLYRAHKELPDWSLNFNLNVMEENIYIYDAKIIILLIFNFN